MVQQNKCGMMSPEVRDKVGIPPGELGVSKSMECDNFPSVL